MEEKITLQQGEGTKSYQELIKRLFVKNFSNEYLDKLSDAANLPDYVFTCDSFTVDPIFFPGGDIGKLSVYGTINDILVSAAKPLYLSCAIIVEEGFLFKDLERITLSIAQAAKISKVKIVTGDFKVVEKGKADKIFITTSGIGKKISARSSNFTRIKHKDKIIVTGPIAEHGISVLLARKNIFNFKIKSDCSSLNYLTQLWRKFPAIGFMRDPTRGGIAAVLNEVNLATGFGIRVFEEKVPVKKDVEAACEILGIDYYYLASEGRAIIIVEDKFAARVLKGLKKYSKAAAIIGEVDKNIDKVIVDTIAGGERLLDFSRILNIPRIC